VPRKTPRYCQEDGSRGHPDYGPRNGASRSTSLSTSAPAADPTRYRPEACVSSSRRRASVLGLSNSELAALELCGKFLHPYVIDHAIRTVRCKQYGAPRLGASFPRKTAAGRVPPAVLVLCAQAPGQLGCISGLRDRQGGFKPGGQNFQSSS
jgi:hypothetical protein